MVHSGVKKIKFVTKLYIFLEVLGPGLGLAENRTQKNIDLGPSFGPNRRAGTAVYRCTAYCTIQFFFIYSILKK